jgi:hypothetical protein
MTGPETVCLFLTDFRACGCIIRGGWPDKTAAEYTLFSCPARIKVVALIMLPSQGEKRAFGMSATK